jgi:hypothetical protein
MEAIYICEECGKAYSDLDRAENCEFSCKFINMISDNDLFNELKASYNFIDIPNQENIVEMVFGEGFQFKVIFDYNEGKTTLFSNVLYEYLLENEIRLPIEGNFYPLFGNVNMDSVSPYLTYYNDEPLESLLNKIYSDLEDIYEYFLDNKYIEEEVLHVNETKEVEEIIDYAKNQINRIDKLIDEALEVNDTLLKVLKKLDC